jgi:hypothetical protein
MVARNERPPPLSPTRRKSAIFPSIVRLSSETGRLVGSNPGPATISNFFSGASLEGKISICRIRDFLRGSLLRTPRAYFIGTAQHSYLASKHENCIVLALARQRAGS